MENTTDMELSGMYFRVKRGDKWDNVCFEDLTEEQMREQMEGRNEERLKNLAIHFAKMTKTLAVQFSSYL